MTTILPILLAIAGFLLILWGAADALRRRAKDRSDKCVSYILRLGARFENELTGEGKIEQEMWRQQRLQDLRQRKMRGLLR
jgi:hypothetical protein